MKKDVINQLEKIHTTLDTANGLNIPEKAELDKTHDYNVNNVIDFASFTKALIQNCLFIWMDHLHPIAKIRSINKGMNNRE